MAGGDLSPELEWLYCSNDYILNNDNAIMPYKLIYDNYYSLVGPSGSPVMGSSFDFRNGRDLLVPACPAGGPLPTDGIRTINQMPPYSPSISLLISGRQRRAASSPRLISSSTLSSWYHLRPTKSGWMTTSACWALCSDITYSVACRV